MSIITGNLDPLGLGTPGIAGGTFQLPAVTQPTAIDFPGHPGQAFTTTGAAVNSVPVATANKFDLGSSLSGAFNTLLGGVGQRIGNEAAGFAGKLAGLDDDDDGGNAAFFAKRAKRLERRLAQQPITTAQTAGIAGGGLLLVGAVMFGVLFLFKK